MEPARGSLMSENEIAKLSAMDGTTATADSLESDFVSQIHERVISVKK